MGAMPYPVWGLLFAIQIARDYRLRGERLAASERRFHAIFDQTFQFMGLMTVDGTLIEVNQTALRFAGIRGEDVIGKLFWETPWWTHSVPLQERVRQACRPQPRARSSASKLRIEPATAGCASWISP